MENELEDKILTILDQHQVGVLTSVQEDFPHARYMTFLHDGLTLYTPSGKELPKTEEVRRNPLVCVLIGYDGPGSAFLEINGLASLEEDESIKERVWENISKEWFQGDGSPSFVVIKIVPEQIRILNSEDDGPDTLDLIG
ncbi:pyridoxamine 5'-phosphate oxidase family protein [Listeria swaminathanii]|uniref:Pyridoxamine 5'-phosphate oxidase family protein n=1 Tax=Listeria swaminathanii TaxID=2713501 RepID=A0ABU2IGK6_9LIST|nr:pyridoxamine 5'-phosphate oxidase family protein [Listeria swaminathanii]MDT0017136.1 pyridoxamine 5'-phosphate oxidase family protein [Listeria swaminathanii]MDT0023090.1 pyridoxamine 5'-phosphate oxidase family protein [Listeria swaminathanii]MDT0034032.1 pyridoxamine 5'-phosphate oxidase family protein [Listeria swaminathanii]MDT0052855.1 pyridoxamine 5'-phosphate oxidase family protein [Listeria swaminathanii]MDT0055620.1 pyridoxamine 5'-phosphate oxidase family protein [Listeria swamin